MLLVATIITVGGCGAGETPSTRPEAPMNEVEPQSAEEAPEAMPPVPPAQPAENLAAAIDALAVDIYQQVRSGEGNLVFSPASISLAFGMTWAGAAGDTADEMASVLHYPGDSIHDDAHGFLARWNGPHQGLTLRVVDRLFAEQSYTFEEPYLALMRDRYSAPVERVDFAGDAPAQRAHINRWVAEQTEDRIRELLPPGVPDSTARLVLVNAVYFLGQWMSAFDPSATRPELFASPSGSVEAQMMRQTARLLYGETDDAQILQMSYHGDRYAMMIILPKSRTGLVALEASMDVATLASWQASISARRVDVVLPRFTIDGAKLDLGNVLQALGMRRAFSREAADFSNMARPANPADELYIAAAVHEAFIEVSEEGTEAAAATAVVMATRGRAPRPQPVAVFRADHPFIFAIRDSRTTLFLGRVVDPT